MRPDGVALQQCWGSHVRMQVLSSISKSQKTVPTTVEFVDIAGLVKGASKGEGLGNQFLATIRECDAIAQVCGPQRLTPGFPAHGNPL